MDEENEQELREKRYRYGAGRRRKEWVEYETIAAEKRAFGKNNFIEIARKRAKTSQGVNEFIAISRGYYMPNGKEQFKTSLAIPDDIALKEFIAEKIKIL